MTNKFTMKVDFEPNQIKAFFEVLGDIKQSAKNSIMRGALNEIGKGVVKEARPKIPRRTGMLRKSLQYFTKIFRTTNNAVLKVGPWIKKISAKQQEQAKNLRVDPRNYAHLVERGFVHRSGKQVPARPFLRPAWQSVSGRVAAIFKSVSEKVLSKLAAKAKSKLGKK